MSVSMQSQANALSVAGSLAYWQYDFEQANILLEEGLSLFQILGDHRGIVASLNRLGINEIHKGNIGASDALLEEVLRLCRLVGDQEGIADNLLNQGDDAFYRGEFVRAQACCKESLALYSELEDTFGKAVSLLSLGWIAYYQGEYTTARQLSEESVEQFSKFGHSGFEIEAMTFVTIVEAALGDGASAARLFEEVLAHGREQEHLDVIAQALWGLGRSALAQGKPAWSTWLYGSADAFRTVRANRNPFGIMQPHYDNTLAEVRSQLGAKVLLHSGKKGSI